MKISLNKRIWSFDCLRSILCIFVVALHCNLANAPAQYLGASELNSLWYRLALYNVFWACVPIFYSLSLVLYLNKRCDNDGYFSKRMRILIFQYLFWGFIEVLLVNSSTYNLSQLDIWVVFCLISSHNNILYFIFHLIWLTAIQELLFKLFFGKLHIKSVMPLASIGLVIAAGAMFFFPRCIK